VSKDQAPFIPRSPDEAPVPPVFWRVFGTKSYFRLWIAQIISSTGDWIGLIAILAIAARVSHNSGAAVSVVMLARVVPGFFLGTIGGVIIDRFDRRKVMVFADVGRAGLLLVLPFTDGILSRTMDLIWAYPVILLGIALGTALAVGGLDFGLFTVSGASLWIPAIIIGVVYIPYMAKPLRGQVLSLREKEFVEAARAQGAGNLRIMFREILPNIATSIIVFIPLMIANAILLEAALSFLGAGVQAPNPSWGTMIGDGIRGAGLASSTETAEEIGIGFDRLTKQHGN